MDTTSMMDDDPTLPIDFDQSTNIVNFLQKDKMDSFGSRRESLLSQEESSSEAVKSNHQVNGQNTPERATLREHEEIIATFKKENFGLKLRIYFLEERLQMAYEEDTENVLKTNIELKVNIEQLKKELTEKQQLLIKASNAIETITSESEKHVTKLKAEFTKQYDAMVNELQHEVEIRDKELQKQEKSIEMLNQEFTKAEEANKELEKNLKALSVNPEAIEELRSKQRDIEEKYEKEILEKEKKIKELKERNSNEETEEELKILQEQVAEKEKKIQNLKEEVKELAKQSPDRANSHYEILYNKLEAQSAKNENKMKELTKELTKKSNLVEELKDYISKTERVNKELRNSIHDKETEKHRSSISLQEHIRRLDLALSNKEKEASRCYAQIEQLEESNKRLQKDLMLKEYASENKSADSQEKMEAIAALKADLQEKELQFKKFKQALEDKDKELMYFNNAKLRAEQDLDTSIAKKNLEIQAISEQLKELSKTKQNKLKSLEDHCQKMQQDAKLQINKKDKLIQRLTNALRNKDILIEDILSQTESMGGGAETPQDTNSVISIVKKLRSKLKDMDQTLEANLDEQFKSIDAKDNDILELKRNLRDKERELELVKANVAACEGVITHLETISKEKDNTMKDLKGALELQESSFKVSSETAAKELEECQANMLKLSRLLDVKEEEINELQKNFLKTGTDLDEKSIKAIYDQLNTRHKLNQELASERDAAVIRNEINKQKFISALNSKDAQIREAFLRMGRLSEEKNGEIKNLKALVDEKNEQLRILEKKVSESQSEMLHQFAENEKDQEIENLAKSGLEKDRIISELQEHLNLKRHVLYEEMENLKEKLRISNEDLEKKSDELTEYKVENKHLQEKLNDLKRSENIEITMKFDNLRSELNDRERKLENARDEVKKMQSEVQQATNHAESIQSKVNSLQQENDAHILDIEALQSQSKRKDALTKAQLDSVQTEIEALNLQKDALEKKLKEGDLATVGLEKRLEENKRNIESMALEKENLNRENRELKLELERRNLVPKENYTPVGASADEANEKELKEALQSQLEEQKQLFEAAEKEKLYLLTLIQELRNQLQTQHSSVSPNLDLELQSATTFQSQYDNSVRESEIQVQHLGNRIKTRRESPLKSSGSPTSPQTEIADLKQKLEESEKCNRSLQTRFNDLLTHTHSVEVPIHDADGTDSACNDAIEKLKEEYEVAISDCFGQKSMCNLLQKQLEAKVKELETTTKNLADLKVHYDMFTQLKNKEIEALTNSCEQRKKVIEEFEEKVTSLRNKLELLQISKEQEIGALRKQIDGISAVNDVLRKTLNEKIEELKQVCDKAVHQEENYKKIERLSRSLSEDKNVLMNQMQQKSEQIIGMKKEIESLKLELQKSKENQSKKISECESLQKDMQELRTLNERLRRTLSDVSKGYESSEKGVLNLKMDLDQTQNAVDEQRRQNSQLNAVNMRLRDEIRGLQESSCEVQRLADELKKSQNLNRALQKQLNELAESNQMPKNSVEPELDGLRVRVTELEQSNSAYEEKMRFYERQAAALQAEYRDEKRTFERERKSLTGEIEVLKEEVEKLNEVKTGLESKVKELFYESESYKSMIERLEGDNRKKQTIVENLESELRQQRDVKIHSLATTPHRTAHMSSQTTPSKLSDGAENVGCKEIALKEALQKRDNYIEALKKQLEFYKTEKGRSEMENKKSEDNISNKSDLIAMHISEMRELRRELEQSINNNNALRDHLEHRLSEAEKEAEKLKDPNIRASILRENDSLRAKIAEYDIRMRELQTVNEKLQQEGQRSSGRILEKDSRIEELKVALEVRNSEVEQMQTFSPERTSSTVSSPIHTTMRFTQTTPRKQALEHHRGIQVDTIFVKSEAERQQLEEKLRLAERTLKEKEVLIGDIEKRKETEKQEVLCSVMNMKLEITDLKASIEKKDLLISNLRKKVLELEAKISTEYVKREIDSDKKAANDELIALHISEMQKLKKELELSIKNNDELKSQLELRMLMIEKDATNIKDPKFRVNIIRDNDLLRSQSIERQNAVSRLQAVVDQLLAEKKSDKECIKKLHQQIHNLNKTTENLKEEISLYDRLQQQLNQTSTRSHNKSDSPEAKVSIDENADPKFDSSLLQLLLEEIRNLRVQLQRSIDANMALKEKVEEQLGLSFNTSGFRSPAADARQLLDEEKGNTVRRALFSSLGGSDAHAMEEPEKPMQQMLLQEAPTKENGSPGSRSSFMSPNSLAAAVNDAAKRNLFVRGRLEDFVLLRNKLAKSSQRIIVIQDIHTILQKQKQISSKQMEDLQEEVGRISSDLRDCRQLVDLMWSDENIRLEENSVVSVDENQHLKSEIANLKKRLLSQERLLKTSLQRLEESNKLKENLEQQILSKLKTTHGTIVKASQNLKEKIDKSKTPPKKSS